MQNRLTKRCHSTIIKFVEYLTKKVQGGYL